MSRDFYKSPKSTRIMRLFWKAAGADRYILERTTYSDQVKYLCLGGIIVATGLMAGIAGGYGFYTIFEPKGNALNSFKTSTDIAGTYDPIDLATMIKSMVFGIIWGLIIFNIDRFIISSTGKGDGTEDITKKELKGALPRLFIACGRQEDLYPLSLLFHAACQKLGVEVDYHEEDGKHDWFFWDTQIRRFLNAVLGTSSSL